MEDFYPAEEDCVAIPPVWWLMAKNLASHHPLYSSRLVRLMAMAPCGPMRRPQFKDRTEEGIRVTTRYDEAPNNAA
jgi:hypothetical protein